MYDGASCSPARHENDMALCSIASRQIGAVPAICAFLNRLASLVASSLFPLSRLPSSLTSQNRAHGLRESPRVFDDLATVAAIEARGR